MEILWGSGAGWQLDEDSEGRKQETHSRPGVSSDPKLASLSEMQSLQRNLDQGQEPQASPHHLFSLGPSQLPSLIPLCLHPKFL